MQNDINRKNKKSMDNVIENPQGRDLFYNIDDQASVGDTITYKPNTTLRGFVIRAFFDSYAIFNELIEVPHDFTHKNSMGCRLVLCEYELDGFKKINGEEARLKMRTEQHASANVVGVIDPNEINNLFDL